MDPRTSLRIGVVGLLGLALFVAAYALGERDATEVVRVFPAVVPADPIAAELTRCQKLGLEAAGNSTCEDAWAQNRARFFASPSPSTER